MMFRRFLLYKNNDLNMFTDDKKSTNREVFFTKINRCKSIYYIKEKKVYKKVVKSFETTIVDISKKEYKKEKNNSIGKILKKKVYELDNNSSVIKYDDGFVFLESKFDDIEQLKEFYQSDFFKTYVDEDVTNNTNFNDYSLAKFNHNDLNIYKVFKDIKNSRRCDMKKVIYKDMNSANAIRIELFLLYTKLIKNKNEILAKSRKGEDTLSKYIKNLLKTIVILKEYKKIFEKDLAKHVIKNLELIYSHTNIHQNIVSIRENFALIEGCIKNKSFRKFLKSRDDEISENIDAFLSFLKSKEYAIILKQLELLIKEGSLEENIDLEDSIEKTLSKKIKKSLKKFKKLFIKNIDCDSVDGLNKIIYKFKRVEILRNEFSYLFEDDEFYSKKRAYDKLKINLESYYNLLVLEEILIEDITKENHIECLKKDIIESKTKLLKTIKKSFKKI